MKFSCDRLQLLEAMLNVQRAVSIKSSIPALEGIYIRASRDNLYLCGYDLDLGISTKIPAKAESIGEIVINAKLFVDMLRKLSGDIVEISTNEKYMIHIFSGNTDFDVIGIPATDYPELPVLRDTDTIEIESSKLKSLIKQTIFAVAVSDTKPIQTGVLFEIEENIIKSIAVDGYQMAIRKEKINYSEKLHFVVPNKTLSEVEKTISDDSEENVEIQLGKRHIIFSFNGYNFVSRLLEGEFLDYKTAIPSEHTTEIIINTREFINSIERMSLLITERIKYPVRCIFSDNSAKLSCITSIGKCKDKFDIDMTGDDIEIGFNNKYLLNALRHTESDEVRIHLSNMRPMVVLPKEGDDYLFLVLPVLLS